jgi:hypothetical protein
LAETDSLRLFFMKTIEGGAGKWVLKTVKNLWIK